MSKPGDEGNRQYSEVVTQDMSTCGCFEGVLDMRVPRGQFAVDRVSDCSKLHSMAFLLLLILAGVPTFTRDCHESCM